MTDQLVGKAAFPYGNDTECLAEVYGDPRQWIKPGVKLADGEFPTLGQLDEPKWRASIMGDGVLLPSPLRVSHSKGLVTKIYPHKLLRSSLIDIFEELKMRDLWRHIKCFAGCYAYRLQRGGDSLSVHSFAAAIDFNDEDYPLGSQPRPSDPYVAEVLPVFKAHGWRLGAEYVHRKDVMHCEAVK